MNYDTMGIQIPDMPGVQMGCEKVWFLMPLENRKPNHSTIKFIIQKLDKNIPLWIYHSKLDKNIPLCFATSTKNK